MIIAALAWILSGPVQADPLALETSLHENAPGGCTACGCKLVETLPVGMSSKWWFTFAGVENDPVNGWRRKGPLALSHCGHGAWHDVRDQLESTNGVPYVIVTAEFDSQPTHGGDSDSEILWRIQRFDRFGWTGKPKYSSIVVGPGRDGSDGFQSIVRALVASDREREQFRIDNLVVGLTVRKAGVSAPGYGGLAVESDVPGAWVFVDGEYVGRVADGSPLHVENLVVGPHRVAVRDFSGRTFERDVEVLAQDSIAVRLDLLPLNCASSNDHLCSLGANASGFEEYWRPLDRATMVQVPAGTFIMGTDKPGTESFERPAHEVKLRDFLIDKTEVTWRQYERFTQATGSGLPPVPMWGRQPDFALSFVVWEEAEAYCTWVGGRLPSEAEWEKAARGVDGRTYPWGDKWEPGRCNSIAGGLHRPEAVGSFSACVSPYGVLDMIGSHWQWVQDYFDPEYYQNSPAENPVGPEQSQQRSKRGGYWMSHPEQLRVTARGASSPDWRNFSHGFRCAADLQATP